VEDFMRVTELAQRAGLKPQTIYNMYSKGTGVLAPILTKFGSKLGCWRSDWDAFTAAQKKLPAQSGTLDATNAQGASIKNNTAPSREAREHGKRTSRE
jgi:predicted DNA-binding transcriptional regulator AlpA